MGNAVVEEYVRERDGHLNTINVLTTTAKERGKDPTDEDLETIGRLKLRIGKIDQLVDVLGDDLEMSDETRNKLARLQPGVVPVAPKYRSPGELMWDCIHATWPSPHDAADQEAVKRYGLVMKRAAEHIGTTAENTTPVAGGFGAIAVNPIVGPVISIFPSAQPLLTGIGVQQAPSAYKFERPRIVDPNFKTGAGVQTLEKAELVSKKFDLATDTLQLTTVGGYLNLSVQLLSLVPTALTIVINQLQKRVAYQGEAAAVTELLLTTSSVPLADATDPAAVIKAIVDAAALVYENTGEAATWIAMGPQGWAMLASLTDAAGRPLFPFMGAANALGSANANGFTSGPMGLNDIVTPGITDKTLIVGNSMAMEAYSYNWPVLEAVEPSLLGKQVAVAQSICFYRPTTDEAVVGPPAVPASGNGAVKITSAP